MLQVTVKISGDVDMINKLKKLGQSLYLMQSAMEQIGRELGDGGDGYFPQTAFNSKGSVFGKQWTPLSIPYRNWKSKRYDAMPMLELTGDMRRSFYYEASESSVVVGNRDPKFDWHQLGKGNNPQRQMIGVNDDVKSIIRRIIDAEIKNKIARAI